LGGGERFSFLFYGENYSYLSQIWRKEQVPSFLHKCFKRASSWCGMCRNSVRWLCARKHAQCWQTSVACKSHCSCRTARVEIGPARRQEQCDRYVVNACRCSTGTDAMYQSPLFFKRKKPTDLSYSRNYSRTLKAKVSLPCKQQPATWPYPKPDYHRPCSPILFL